MNVLDVGILIILGMIIWMGSMRTPLREVSASLGAIAGFLIAIVLYRQLAFLAANSLGRTVVLGLLILAAGFICHDILLTAGLYVERKWVHYRHAHGQLSTRVRITSSAIAGVSGIILIWLTISVFSLIAVPFVQREIHGSALVSFGSEHVPIPTLLRQAAGLLEPFAQPQAFASAEPNFASSTAVSQDFAQLDAAVSRVSPSVFKVSSWGCGATTQGSGFLVSAHDIVTNAHVVAGTTRISVQGSTDPNIYVAQVVWFDPAIDIAVLNVAPSLSQTPLQLNTAKIAPGAIASVLGFPGGGTYATTDATVIQSLNARGYDIYNKNTITRSIYALRASVVPGNSGGPLIGDDGRVLGLVFGNSTTQNRTGYAIASAQISGIITKATQQNSPTSSGSCESNS